MTALFEHTKWAMMTSSKIEKVVSMLQHIGCTNISYYIDKIIRTSDSSFVMDAYVVEFDIDYLWKQLLMETFDLKEVRGYLM